MWKVTGVRPGLGGLLLLAGLVVAAGQAFATQEVWVEAEGIVAMGQETTLEAAQRGSLDAARRAAIEQAVGTFVRGSTVIRNNQLADDLIHAVVRGVIVEEKILKRGVSDGQDGHGAVYQTRIKARVKGIPAERRGNFAVTARMNRALFNEGDEVELRITPTQDAYLYIFNVAPSEHITVLAPNSFEPETPLRARKEYLFPSETLLSKKVKLRTWLLPGTTRSSEKLKVVVTRQPMALLKGRVAEGVFMEYKPSETALLVELMRELGALDPADWAETTLDYEVKKQ
jgi:hypothetical protein